MTARFPPPGESFLNEKFGEATPLSRVPPATGFPESLRWKEREEDPLPRKSLYLRGGGLRAAVGLQKVS